MSVWLLAATVVPAPASRFVGATRCKLCHRAVYESWQKTPHARTTTVDSERQPICNRCHATDAGNRLPSVQCEACHGAGGDYWPAEVMIDAAKATMAGLVRPTEAVCRRCHTNDVAGHDGAFVMPDASDWSSWVHAKR